MYKKFIKLIIIFGVYFLLIFSLEELSKFIFIRDEFLDINLDYFLFIDTFISLILISVSLIYIRQTPSIIKNKKTTVNYEYIFLVLFMLILYRTIEDPFLRIEIITEELKIPDVLNFKTPSFLSMTITFINVVILTPILEELFFRKILLSVFSKKNMVIGIIATSFLFAMIHINYLNDILRLITFFTFGIISCLIYKRFTLIYSILFHAGYNFIWYLIKMGIIPYWYILKKLNFGFVYWAIISTSLISLVYILFRVVKKLDTPAPASL
ncbi:CAAX protease self-immunity [Tenacibaculum sp. MAR_2010_89]|uniref:CPBP family intramembrane glutamic endopeptidase n=1 Tax=Tenacibaculum sp. MAR_2010_89 TaxID=1250198 RepID=UPI00089CA461|nr:type II CAAX endopeptidase family protein [Tenacibaculum sp. MAR_2010_89]SEE06835.1 CAAX protease self-immunity [Tenacibaculum sp. MAR_2010_89]